MSLESLESLSLSLYATCVSRPISVNPSRLPGCWIRSWGELTEYVFIIKKQNMFVKLLWKQSHLFTACMSSQCVCVVCLHPTIILAEFQFNSHLASRNFKQPSSHCPDFGRICFLIICFLQTIQKGVDDDDDDGKFVMVKSVRQKSCNWLKSLFTPPNVVSLSSRQYQTSVQEEVGGIQLVRVCVFVVGWNGCFSTEINCISVYEYNISVVFFTHL